jgi:hypothetical protein
VNTATPSSPVRASRATIDAVISGTRRGYLTQQHVQREPNGRVLATRPARRRDADMRLFATRMTEHRRARISYPAIGEVNR